MIRKIYDVVLHPEDHEEFMASWEEHITRISSQYDDRRNSENPSEFLPDENGLEQHFARAHAILEKMGRPDQQDSRSGTPATEVISLVFDQTGKVLEQTRQAMKHFGKIKSAKIIEKRLASDSRDSWNNMLDRFTRAPSVGKFTLLSELDGGNLIAFGKRNPDDGKIKIILRRLTIDWSDELQNVLKSSFNLSPKEIELVWELSAVGNLDRLAQKDNRSKHTLRAQLKSVFQKMNVNSQPELMQNTATLSRFCRELDFEPAGQVESQESTAFTFRLRTGRNMPVYFLGPETGRPVVFIHGMMDGVDMPSENLKQLDNHNIRFIAPVRPGFGSADFQEDVIRAPEIYANQIKELVCELELRDFLLLGHMSGSVFSFAAARVLAGKALGIVNISGGIPILSTRQFAEVSPRQKAIAYTARYAPKFLPMILRAGVAQIDAMKIDELMDSIYPEGLLDRYTVKSNGEIARIVGEGYRFAVAQGYKAFQTDAYHVTRDWSKLVHEANLPTLLIHGTHDPVVPIETVRQFAKREHCELSEYEDDGQLVLYNQPERVLRQVSDFYDTLFCLSD